MPGYDPKSIEKKWQAFWLANKTFAAPNSSDKPKFYALDMFPYPSGKGLHVGHPEGYTATDIVSRFKRAKGFAVMHPMGWDAFGLPAEQTAIKDNVHPRETTTKNIETFRRQLQALGFSYDWDREVDTTDVGYYRWTQWIFLQLYDTWFDEGEQRGRPISELIAEFKSGKRPPSWPKSWGNSWDGLSPVYQRLELARFRLAYEASVDVNWCDAMGTVLANEEVIDGKSEVGGFPVERRPMKQWLLRITAYADRLIDGLTQVQWSESLKEMQRNWIGRSEGAEVKFYVDIAKETLQAFADLGTKFSDTAEVVKSDNEPTNSIPLNVFTTRPDTLYGATYMVIAPEHDPLGRLSLALIPEAWPSETPTLWKGNDASLSPREAVAAYQEWAKSRSELERQKDTKKTGVFTGLYATNPVNGKPIPVFMADYVLVSYGTGAIMAVPAHDERDHEFATKFKLPIIQVVAPEQPDANKPIDVQKEAFTDGGLAINSPWIDGLPTQEAKKKITAILEEKGIGKKTVNYKIRDWLFSRQRYWGEPFPLVHPMASLTDPDGRTFLVKDGTTVPLAKSELPLRLPELADFRPTGTIDPPLSKATGWTDVHVLIDEYCEARVVPAGTLGAVPARRELNTMPQWAGSCWYYIRYTDAHNDQRFVDPAAEKFWLIDGVDLYVGGVEHAVLHLLYSRFWHKVLFDRGLVSCDEPFRRLVNQGLILGEVEYTAFRRIGADEYVSIEEIDLKNLIESNSADIPDPNFVRPVGPNGEWVPVANINGGGMAYGQPVLIDQVEKKGDAFFLKANPAIRVDARSFKMSKSRGNVVDPDDVIEHYGADSLRLFEMFMGPLEQVKPWSTAGVEGVYRFLQRVWRNIFDVETTDPAKENKLLERHPEGKIGTWYTVWGELPADQHAQAEADYQAQLPILHRTIKKVEEDIERLSFNTAIAAMMELNNALGKMTFITLEVAEAFLRILEPFAPHFAEEVLFRIRPDLPGMGITSITQRPWPAYNPALLIESTLEIPVQVNGKLRGRIFVPADSDEATILAAALADPEVQKHTAGKEPKKKIYVKGRMVNLVV